MPLWQVVLDVVVGIAVLFLLFGLALIVRRRVLSRNGGTFELSYRVRPERVGRGWLLGIGRYSGDSLEWFRIFSLWPRPMRTWSRAELSYVRQRQPEGVEKMSLYADHVVVTCESRDGEVELALSVSSLTGLQAWLEAAPPGTRMIV